MPVSLMVASDACRSKKVAYQNDGRIAIEFGVPVAAKTGTVTAEAMALLPSSNGIPSAASFDFT